MGRFYPDFKLSDVPEAEVEVLEKGFDEAKEGGLRYVCIVNVSGYHYESAYCGGCGTDLIKSKGTELIGWMEL